MAIQFNCPYCTAPIKVPDSSSGKIGRCPKCETRLRVPDLAPAGTTGNKAQPPALAPVNPPPVAKGALLEDDVSAVIAPPQELLSLGEEELLSAREEYDLGKAWLSRPVIPGAGWPAADRAVGHFSRAAELDPANGDYAMHAGVACHESIERFLQSWGAGPLVSIAAFLVDQPLGKKIDQSQRFFQSSNLTSEHRDLLRNRAAEAFLWFSRALVIDPNDSVTRSARARLLCSIGAFAPALAEASRVLASPLTPSKTRQQAQEVTDFILGEDSKLREFLTRSEAQRVPGPMGIDLRLDPPPAPVAPAPAPVTAAPFPAAPAVVTTGSAFDFAPVAPAPVITVQPEPGMSIVQITPAAAQTTSIASQLKQRRSGGWGKLVIPGILALILVGIGLGYLWINRPTFSGTMTGEGLGDVTISKLLLRTEFGCPDDVLDRMLGALQTEPMVLPTHLRRVQLTGSARGVDVSVRGGEQGRLVRVDLRSHPQLYEFAEEHAGQLEAARQASVSTALSAFCRDWDNAHSSGMSMGNTGNYLETLGGDALVGGLGYHTIALVDNEPLQCVYEDPEGRLYYLIPKGTTRLRIVERNLTGREPVFADYDFGFDVTVQEAAPVPPAQPPAGSGATP
jgi:hypothetical protein